MHSIYVRSRRNYVVLVLVLASAEIASASWMEWRAFASHAFDGLHTYHTEGLRRQNGNVKAEEWAHIYTHTGARKLQYGVYSIHRLRSQPPVCIGSWNTITLTYFQIE